MEARPKELLAPDRYCFGIRLWAVVSTILVRRSMMRALTRIPLLLRLKVPTRMREIGKRDGPTLERFLRGHGRQMPRTMLRYAIRDIRAFLANDLRFLERF